MAVKTFRALRQLAAGNSECHTVCMRLVSTQLNLGSAATGFTGREPRVRPSDLQTATLSAGAL